MNRQRWQVHPEVIIVAQKITESPCLSIATSLPADARTIGLVGFAHLASHFFQLVIPPMFPVLKEEFGLGYTELGFVMTLFFIVSGGLQTVAGVVADRYGARLVLFWGVALISLGILLCGLAPSYPLLIAAAVIAGIGNSVFHPAGFAILNARVDVSRLGHAFSVFNIGGHLGWALAPVYLFAVAAWGWRVSLMGAGLLGFAMLALLWTQRDAMYVAVKAAEAAGTDANNAPGPGLGDLRVLAAPAVLMCFLFFVLLSTSMVGTQNYLIPLLHALYDAPLLLGSSALTAYLLGSAAGTFTGGFVVTRSRHPERVAAGGVLALALFYLLLASGTVPLMLIVAGAVLAGFSLGITLPARDMLVRGIAPERSRGKVYGFVYSGLDLGAAIAPSLLGWQLDHGQAAGALITLAAMLLFAILLIVLTRRSQQRAAPA